VAAENGDSRPYSRTTPVIGCSTLSTTLLNLSFHPSPSSPFSTLTPSFNQKVGHVLVQFPVRPTHLDAMITAAGEKSPTCQLRLGFFLDRATACFHAPVSEHPELVIPDVLLGKHVQQMCRVRKVDVIVAAPVREQIVDLVKGGHVRDRRVDVPARVERGQVHVSFSVD